MSNRVVFDTNLLLHNLEVIDDYEDAIIPVCVLDELDKQKIQVGELGYRARTAIRKIKQCKNITYDEINTLYPELKELGWTETNDNLVISSCLRYKADLVTSDVLMQVKAEMMEINVVYVESLKKSEEYSGWKDVYLTQEEMAEFYSNKNKNRFNLLVGEYLIIYDELDNAVDACRWNGSTHESICRKDGKLPAFQSMQLGKFIPKDLYQQCAMDSLNRNPITLIKGKAGSGKSLLSLSYAMNMIEKNKFMKLIIFSNPTPARGAARLGFYPGERDEKLLDSSIGAMLSSKFGDQVAVENLISSGKIMLFPFSDIRGFDTTGMKAIVYISEAQNLTVDLMKLAIQRCGEDSKLIIDGDFTAQVDMIDYEGSNNGMRRASEVFRNHSVYGEVELPNIYRSKIAQIAESM